MQGVIQIIGNFIYDIIINLDKGLGIKYSNIINYVKNNIFLCYYVALVFIVVIFIKYFIDVCRTFNRNKMNMKGLWEWIKHNWFKKIYLLVRTALLNMIVVYSVILSCGEASTGTPLKELHGEVGKRSIIAFMGGGPKGIGGGMRLGYKVIILIFLYLLMINYIKQLIKLMLKHIKQLIKSIYSKIFKKRKIKDNIEMKE